MKERPILFSASMVSAIMRGEKTQTRRIVSSLAERPVLMHATVSLDSQPRSRLCQSVEYEVQPDVSTRCPYGQPGDRLWVRESFCYSLTDKERFMGVETLYRADFRGNAGLRWRSGIYMPRRAARILLDVQGVEMQRLHDITDAEAIAEGVLSVNEDRFFARHFPEYLLDVEAWATRAVQRTRPHLDRPPDPPAPRARFRALWNDIHGKHAWDENPWVWVVRFAKVPNE